MRLESLPPILGILFGVIGIVLILDAWLPESFVMSTERRRLPRRERDRPGEALVGLGIIALSGTFLAGDTWRYSVFAVIGGALLLLWGAKRSGSYLRSVFTRADRPKPTVVEGSRRVR